MRKNVQNQTTVCSIHDQNQVDSVQGTAAARLAPSAMLPHSSRWLLIPALHALRGAGLSAGSGERGNGTLYKQPARRLEAIVRFRETERAMPSRTVVGPPAATRVAFGISTSLCN